MNSKYIKAIWGCKHTLTHTRSTQATVLINQYTGTNRAEFIVMLHSTAFCIVRIINFTRSSIPRCYLYIEKQMLANF